MKRANNIYTGANGRQSLIDFEEPEGYDYEDIVVFIHGLKGYKDWGAWNMMQDVFVKNGIAFCKFNMSHNGGTLDNPMDFPDLEAFSKNRYSYEVHDIIAVLDWLEHFFETEKEEKNMLSKRIHLVGHSRGGGIAVLAGNDERVSTVTTWAGISSIPKRFPTGEAFELWKEKGVYTIKNSRTKQDMPVLFSLYEDWKQHQDLLNIEEKAKQLEKPTLHLHGDKDETVSITESEALSSWTEGKLMIINNANHTFNTFHPYDEEDIPNKLHEACELTLRFIS